MQLHRTFAAAAFLAASLASSGAFAFSFTEIGGKNADGSAQYQDREEQQLTAPLGGSTTVQQGSGFNQNPASGFQWSVTQSQGFAGPNSGFNEPLLRDRR